MLKSLLSNKEKLLELANTPLNENCSAVILKKLPEKLGLPELISTQMILELANREICTPVRIARDVFVPVGKFTFPVDFVIVDYESDPHVPLILGRPFLRIAHALIDVHGEEMILRDGNEILILNMRHDTSSYLNEPHQESINMIDVYNVSHEEILKYLFATNHPSGNPTSSLTSLTNLTSPEVNDDIFDPEEDIIEKLLNLDKTKDLPLYPDNQLSGNPTPISEPETKSSSSSPTLTSIEESDLIWEEFEAYLASDSFTLGNSNPLSPLPPFHNSLSSNTTSSSPSLPISETSDYFLEEFADELVHITFPLRNDDLPFNAESDLREIEYFLNHDPIKEMDSILEDSVDENSLDGNLDDTISEMFTGWDQPPLQIMKMLYCFVNNIHVDYAELLWEGLYYSLHHPTSLIPYPRFTKIIISHYMTSFPKISRWRYKDKVGKQIPEWMISKEMKNMEHYRMRSTRLTPPAPVPTINKADEMILQDTLQVSLAEHKSREEQEARENMELVNKHLASEEIEKMMEGSKNVIYNSLRPRNDELNIPGTRLEPRSDKEIPEVEITNDEEVEITNVVMPVNVNEEEEEITDEVYELKRREKGKIVEESRSTPFPTPVRSPRIHTDLVSLILRNSRN
ncbi:reverse transcriptase domain-containing protein [Tanacetum coccineum]